jgi:hypothetical protein
MARCPRRRYQIYKQNERLLSTIMSHLRRLALDNMQIMSFKYTKSSMQLQLWVRQAGQWIQKRKSQIGTALIMSIVAALVSIVSYAAQVSQIAGLNSTILVPALFGGVLLAVYGVSYWHGFTLVKTLHRELVIGALSILLVLFFARISSTAIQIGGVVIQFTTVALCTLLPIMTGAVLQWFGAEGLSRASKNVVVFITLLALFSFLQSVRTISSSNAIFFNQTLEFLITKVSAFFWMALAAFLLAGTNVGAVDTRKQPQVLMDAAVHIVAYLQLIIAVYLFSLSEFGLLHIQYWTMALLAFVLWDTATRVLDFSVTAKNTQVSEVFYTVGYNMVLIGLIITVAYMAL